MRKTSLFLIAACILATAPAMAGDLSFQNGKTQWQSTQCTKPTPPASILNADSETSGDDMNALMTKHNAYVAAAQTYMNCVSNEAQHDQASVDQEIAASAQSAITDIQQSIDADAKALRARQK